MPEVWSDNEVSSDTVKSWFAVTLFAIAAVVCWLFMTWTFSHALGYGFARMLSAVLTTLIGAAILITDEHIRKLIKDEEPKLLLEIMDEFDPHQWNEDMLPRSDS